MSSDWDWDWGGDGDGSPRRWQYNAQGHPPPAITFNHEGVLWQKSSFSKYVSGWSPLPFQQKKNYQVDSNNNNLGESNMIKEKIINNP